MKTKRRKCALKDFAFVALTLILTGKCLVEIYNDIKPKVYHKGDCVFLKDNFGSHKCTVFMLTSNEGFNGEFYLATLVDKREVYFGCEENVLVRKQDIDKVVECPKW